MRKVSLSLVAAGAVIGPQVDRPDQLRSLEHISPPEEVVPSSRSVGVGRAAHQGVLLIQRHEGMPVSMAVGLGDLVEQDTARHVDHSPHLFTRWQALPGLESSTRHSARQRLR